MDPQKENSPETDEELTCDDCGCKGAKRTICPYTEEIHGKEVEVDLCDHCYHERCMDI